MTGQGIVLLLPGQGFQHAGMAVELYRREPRFATVADEFLAALGPGGETVREDWLACVDGAPADRGTTAQPLLFMIGYGIGAVLAGRGLRPSLLIGHSVGELAAATLAGVFDLHTAARILAARCAALAEAPPGGMLAVAGAPRTVLDCIRSRSVGESVVVGAHNGPLQTVLAGPEPQLSEAERAVRAGGMAARRVRSLEPWHSPAMDRAARRFAAAVAAETLDPATIPIVSTRTGRVVTDAEAALPEFWAAQMAEPVLFWPALDSVLGGGEYTVVDGAPAGGLATLARRHASVRAGRSRVVPLLAPPGRDAWTAWTKGLAELEARA
ncbi:acyltransferase domain-containing protein [Streptomyces sp. NBC_01232]|uniref:acyltransferase domain-containing protein n=1 Tax=Streptomyces sp. NBC_01232 TaxID=2903786 RepID=UPI002E144E5D|nr:acyltransferase domain-containing protein [Streptomyces sp. NBC_01232]